MQCTQIAREHTLILPIFEAGLVSTLTATIKHHTDELQQSPSKASAQAALLLALETLADLGSWASKRFVGVLGTAATGSVRKMNLLPLDTSLAAFMRSELLFHTLAQIVVAQTRVKFVFPALNVLWCCLSTTPTYDVALDSIVSFGGRCAQRIVQLLESSVRQVGETAMRVLLQACLREEGRAALIACEVAEPLRAIAATTAPWQSPPAMFAICCLQALTAGPREVQRLPNGNQQVRSTCDNEVECGESCAVLRG